MPRNILARTILKLQRPGRESSSNDGNYVNGKKENPKFLVFIEGFHVANISFSIIEELFAAFDAYLKALSAELNINIPDLTNSDIAAGIFGLDETSLSNRTPTKFEPVKLTPKAGKGGIQVMQSICSGQSTVCATLLELFCANGTAPCSFMTTKQPFTAEQELTLKQILEPQTKLDFCYLETGKFNSDTHAQFLEIIGKLRNKLPTLVIQDCPAFHKTDSVLLAAQNANIFC